MFKSQPRFIFFGDGRHLLADFNRSGAASSSGLRTLRHLSSGFFTWLPSSFRLGHLLSSSRGSFSSFVIRGRGFPFRGTTTTISTIGDVVKITFEPTIQFDIYPFQLRGMVFSIAPFQQLNIKDMFPMFLDDRSDNSPRPNVCAAESLTFMNSNVTETGKRIQTDINVTISHRGIYVSVST